MPRFRGRRFRATIPNAPKHAAAVIFQFGMAGCSWPTVVEELNAWKFRTSRLRRWNVVNARQFWHQMAIPAMKHARGLALESKRGLRSSYLKNQRLIARAREVVADALACTD